MIGNALFWKRKRLKFVRIKVNQVFFFIFSIVASILLKMYQLEF